MKKHTNNILLTLSILGAALSVYLWWYQVTPRIIPCTSGGCENVLNSEYSTLFGVHMSVFGFFFYLSIALVTFFRTQIKHKLLDNVLCLQIIAGLLFTIYLRYLEFFVIHAYCIWCWGSAVIVLLMLIVRMYEKKQSKKKK